MTSRLHKLAALSAVLAAGILAPPALALHQAAGNATPVPVRHYQDLRSPDARDAALHPHYHGQRGALPQPPTRQPGPQALTRNTAGGTSGGSGLGTAPLVGILVAVAAVLAAAGLALRRRQAHPVA